MDVMNQTDLLVITATNGVCITCIVVPECGTTSKRRVFKGYYWVGTAPSFVGMSFAFRWHSVLGNNRLRSLTTCQLTSRAYFTPRACRVEKSRGTRAIGEALTR
ncbi:hypothetical protein BDD12DRAFT_816367 [Trichophaea hybrida]|nr:hypothetical protein BDD12DRAFT_816367 [Trichophaea hybrida]